jgi:hypothetical protein
MAQQIKKKFIQNDAVDSTKIKLLKDQAVRGQKQDGSEVELLKLDGSDKLVHDGQEIAFKSQVDAEASAREQGDEQVQDNLDSEVSRLEGLISSEESSRMSEDSRIEGLLSDEEASRIAGDSDLQGKLDVEKGRIDAILLASQADKDSFAEIVELINSVDTENDSAFASYVLSNNAALAQEVSDRQQGDSDLQDSIDSEESRAMGEESRIESKFDGMMSTETAARQAADSQLQSNIDSEASARQAADSAEQSRAMGVESSLQSQITQEVSDRQSAVSAEASARQSADTTLQSNIDAEETRAMGVEAELQSDLDNLDGYAQDIRSDLDQEILDRQSADSTEQAARIAGDNSLQSSLNSEISARQSADSSLQSQITQEISDRQSAISSEESSRIAGDASTLQSSKDYTDGKISLVMSNLDTEALDSLVEVVTAFQNADSDLNQTISDLSAAATSALAAEQAARIAGDQTLQSNIDAEVLARDAAISVAVMAEQQARELFDGMLDAKIDQEILDRQAGDQQLSDSISSTAFSLMGTINAVNESLLQEISDREAADQALQNDKMSKYGDEAEGEYIFSTGEVMISLLEDRLKVEDGSVKVELRKDRINVTSQAGSGTFAGEGFVVNRTHPETGVFSSVGTDNNETRLGQTMTIDGVTSPLMPVNDYDLTVKKYVDDADASINLQLGMHLEDYTAFRDDTITDIGNLSSRIDALEAQTDGPFFEKQKFVIDESSELSSVELSHECMENSLVVCVGRLMVHKGEDYSVSVVDGKSVLTWMGDFASGGVEAIEEGDVIFVTFARSV